MSETTLESTTPEAAATDAVDNVTVYLENSLSGDVGSWWFAHKGKRSASQTTANGGLIRPGGKATGPKISLYPAGTDFWTLMFVTNDNLWGTARLKKANVVRNGGDVTLKITQLEAGGRSVQVIQSQTRSLDVVRYG